jgi:hypothetical protein
MNRKNEKKKRILDVYLCKESVKILNKKEGTGILLQGICFCCSSMLILPQSFSIPSN